MAEAINLTDWKRDQYVPGGGNALVFYAVHGKFEEAMQLDGQHYRTAGPPAGLRIEIHERKNTPDTEFFISDYLGGELEAQGPEIQSSVLASPQCLMILGEVADPENLNYLRDTVGFIMALLDQGGIAVCDPQRLTWWTAESWENELFDPAIAVPRHHVIILTSLEENNQQLTWVHTRGMRKFGRPDLSIRNVPHKYFNNVAELCNRFIEHQAFGMVVPEGQEILMEGLPGGLYCHHKGDLDDPDFNNVHIEMLFPST